MVSLHVFASAPYLVLLGPTWFIFSELVYAGDCFGKHFCTPIYTHLFVFFSSHRIRIPTNRLASDDQPSGVWDISDLQTRLEMIFRILT